MWYHYLVAAICVYFVVTTLYAQFTTSYSSIVSRVPSLVGLVLSYYILRWCYNGIYPPSMFGARRY